MKVAETYVDIKDIKICPEETINHKMMKYLMEVSDPYRFRVGKTRVYVFFENERGAPLELGLEKIFRRKM